MNHYYYTHDATVKIEKFAGKTISSFFFPDNGEPFDFIRIVFTDGSHLEICAEQITPTLTPTLAFLIAFDARGEWIKK